MNKSRPGESRSRSLWLPILVMLAVVVGGIAGFQWAAHAEEERKEGYFTVIDEDKKEIFMTAIMVAPGDIFIAEDNRAYEIVSVEGDVARAAFIEVMALAPDEEKPRGTPRRLFSSALAALRGVFLGQGEG
ncbi:MAG: hypothetical protein AB1700_14220, partial [Bacillota bacterium]